MYTVCLNCRRQFRINAEHIAAASGQVRCGFCHEQFNALEQLHDQPLSPEQLDELLTLSVLSAADIDEELQFEIPANEEPDEPETVISTDNADADEELERSIAEIGIDETEDVTQKRPDLDDLPPPVAAQLQQASSKETPEQLHYDEALLEEPAAGRSRRMKGFWSLAVLLVIIGTAAQLAWFNRDRVLLDYPELLPYVKQLCQKLDCSVIRERDTRAIQLVNRDVRLHPVYEDTLLVNATMQNELTVRQPYPRVQLTLFNTAGALIGYREFMPTDYLDSSIDIEQGMPVDAPVHFVLEVTGSSEEAVSFEFRFL